MTTLVVIGTSPFVDTSVAVGPFRSPRSARKADEALQHLGYVTEVCELHKVADLEPVCNDESGED